MAATGHFYKKSSDGGAPSLTPTNGSLIAVLDWVLDVGVATYWEKVYSGTNKAVYRSKTGLRPYLRIDDNQGGESALLRIYETMTDVDTGTNPVPNGVNQSVTGFRIMKCDAAEASGHTYHAVGDSEFFAIAINGDTSYTLDGSGDIKFRPFYFGEIASYLAVDNYPVIVGATHETTDDADYNDSYSDLWGAYGGKLLGITGDNAGYPDPNQAEAYFMRTADGAIVGSGAKPWAPIAGNYWRLDKENPAMIQPFHIQCSVGANSGSSAAFWNPGNGGAITRARLPYLYEGSFICGVGYGAPGPNDTITIGTSQYVVLPCTGTGSTQAWGSRTGLMRISDDEPDRS